MVDLTTAPDGSHQPTRTGEPLLQIEDLHTEFATENGVVKAVDGVSLSVEEGETVGIVGESGSGKTVTMLSVMRLIQSPPGKITKGKILFKGQNLLALSPAKMRRLRGSDIGMVFQDPLTSLNPVYTIGDQIMEAIEVHLQLSKKASRERAADALAQVGIANPRAALDAYPHQFSGGMRQRAMIAVAIACEPTLLIADEPTTALDVTIQEQILQLVENLRAQFNMSVVWITHNLGVVAGLADRIVVMYAGEIVEEGSTLEIFENPRHPYTQGLLQSIPRLEVPRGTMLNPIPGVPPNPARLPPGCRFATRCRHRVARCSEHPDLVEIRPAHASRCWVNPEVPIVGTPDGNEIE